MTQTKHYITIVPTEPPSIPERFTLCHYECSDGKEYKSDLSAAAFHWFELGSIETYLRVMCESENLPALDGEVGGTYVIYCDWNETGEKWGPWLNWSTSEPVDFSEVEKAFLYPEAG